jgi:hypothetical protein
VLNTLTEHDFQDAFKNGRGAENSAYVRKVTNLKIIWELDTLSQPQKYIRGSRNISKSRITCNFLLSSYFCY